MTLPTHNPCNRVFCFVDLRWQKIVRALSLGASVTVLSAYSQTPPPAPEQFQPRCQAIPINTKSTDKNSENASRLAGVLEELERAFAQNDAELFASLMSPALLKKKEDGKKIFEGTLLEYDLRYAQLKRNWIWDLDLGKTAEPGRLVSCGDLAIQPVYGPTRQIAIQYSVYSKNQQTRIFILLATTPGSPASPTPRASSSVIPSPIKQRPGIVHLQVQRWTYDGRTPEQLLNDSKRSLKVGELLIGALLAESSARLMEINPYIIPPLLAPARELATQLSKSSESERQSLLNRGNLNPDWKPEMIMPVFRDGTLAAGIKMRMARDFSLNDQTKQCRLVGKMLFPEQTEWRKSFSGFECMAYGAKEDLRQPPRGGSQFFSWASLNSQSH